MGLKRANYTLVSGHLIALRYRLINDGEQYDSLSDWTKNVNRSLCLAAGEIKP
jgi:hypothetical protein